MMCMDQELLSIRHADLVKNTRHVMADRAVTNRQPVRNVFIGKSLLHQADNLAFPFRQGCRPCWRRGEGFYFFREAYSARSIQLHGNLRHRGSIERFDYRQHDFRWLNLEDDAVDTSAK